MRFAFLQMHQTNDSQLFLPGMFQQMHQSGVTAVQRLEKCFQVLLFILSLYSIDSNMYRSDFCFNSAQLQQVAQSEFGVEDYLGAEDWAGMLLMLDWAILFMHISDVLVIETTFGVQDSWLHVCWCFQICQLSKREACRLHARSHCSVVHKAHSKRADMQLYLFDLVPQLKKHSEKIARVSSYVRTVFCNPLSKI